MKNILFFSLSFLLACSFMAHAMDTSDESAKAEPKSYHVWIEEIVEILDQNYPIETHLNLPKRQRLAEPWVKKAVLSRINSTEIDEALEEIRTFNWKSGTLTEKHKKAAKFACCLMLANKKLGVERQKVNDRGYLETTFRERVLFSKIEWLSYQIPEMGGVPVYDDKDSYHMGGR